MWGAFKEVQKPPDRAYLLAYWRWLLGWGKAPSRGKLSPHRAAELRKLARAETKRYALHVKQLNGQGALYDISKGWSPFGGPPNAA